MSLETSSFAYAEKEPCDCIDPKDRPKKENGRGNNRGVVATPQKEEEVKEG